MTATSSLLWWEAMRRLGVNALDCAVEASKDRCSGEEVLGSLSWPARVSVSVESLRAGWILSIPLSQPEAEPKISDTAFDENLNLSRFTFDCRFRRCRRCDEIRFTRQIEHAGCGQIWKKRPYRAEVREENPTFTASVSKTGSVKHLTVIPTK